jgi:hypothetical protein
LEKLPPIFYDFDECYLYARERERKDGGFSDYAEARNMSWIPFLDAYTIRWTESRGNAENVFRPLYNNVFHTYSLRHEIGKLAGVAFGVKLYQFCLSVGLLQTKATNNLIICSLVFLMPYCLVKSFSVVIFFGKLCGINDGDLNFCYGNNSKVMPSGGVIQLSGVKTSRALQIVPHG